MFLPLLQVKTKHWICAVVFVGWLAASLYGAAWLWDFNLRPGKTQPSLPQWPTSSQLTPPEGKPMLVIFLHSECPCSRASLEELSALLAKSRDKVDVQAVFLRPAETGDAVEESGLWKYVHMLPGVKAWKDGTDQEATLFHASTSGETFLYDRAGNLKFRGGITPSRGHIGDNLGVDSIVSIVNGGKETHSIQTPVFGCSLKHSQPPTQL